MLGRSVSCYVCACFVSFRSRWVQMIRFYFYYYYCACFNIFFSKQVSARAKFLVLCLWSPFLNSFISNQVNSKKVSEIWLIFSFYAYACFNNLVSKQVSTRELIVLCYSFTCLNNFVSFRRIWVQEKLVSHSMLVLVSIVYYRSRWVQGNWVSHDMLVLVSIFSFYFEEVEFNGSECIILCLCLFQ